jgi:hypothetical protein
MFSPLILILIGLAIWEAIKDSGRWQKAKLNKNNYPRVGGHSR